MACVYTIPHFLRINFFFSLSLSTLTSGMAHMDPNLWSKASQLALPFLGTGTGLHLTDK